MKNILLLLALLISTSTINAQQPIATAEQPYIEVSGVAEKEIIPDEIYISIIIRERYENKEKLSIEAQEEKLKEALKRIGVNLINLSLSSANADYVRVSWQKKDVLTQKEYTLKVGDAATVGKVFQQLDELSLKDAYIAKVNHSKIDSLKKEVKISAMKAAKDKADYMLNAIGEKTGRALIVRENAYVPYYRGAYANVHELKEVNVMADGATDSLIAKQPEIEFQKIKIEADVFVKFEIKQPK
jgi:uncharacterized protein